MTKGIAVLCLVMLFGPGNVDTNYCYVEAPDEDIYLRVYQPNDYRERSIQTFGGIILAHNKQRVVCKENRILLNFKVFPDGVFSDDLYRTCSGGEVIKLFRSDGK